MRIIQIQQWRWLLCVILLGSSLLTPAKVKAADDNPIVAENLLPGSQNWKLRRGDMEVANDIDKQIKGYASETSVNKSNEITFFITVNPVQTYSIDIYRMGWYQGLGGRLMQHVDALDGIQQPECPPEAQTGLISCEWNPSYTFEVPDTWTSGIYLALLTNSQNYQNYIIFVVRDDKRVADLLYQQPVTTYQAYNNYPNDKKTGKSIYPYNSFGAETITKSKRAIAVSFDRPYKNNGDGDFLSLEIYFVRWLESSGYDVAYSTNLDTHVRGQNLQNYKGFLSVGHDEYWSWKMFDAAETARNKGVNLAFFGGNDVYWQIRFGPSSNGTPYRIITCYKDADLDPISDERLKTVEWRDPVVNCPEQTLMGIQYTSNVNDDAQFDFVITDDTNWVYADTGFKNGDIVPGIVGGEVDRYIPEFPLPANTSHTLLAQSPVTNAKDDPDYANASIYQSPSGAWVFVAGAIQWGLGLDKKISQSPSAKNGGKYFKYFYRFTDADKTNIWIVSIQRNENLAL